MRNITAKNKAKELMQKAYDLHQDNKTTQSRLLYDGQKVRANWDGKLGTVRKLYRESYFFNKSYQYYIDWDNGHWGIASESELSPVI